MTVIRLYGEEKEGLIDEADKVLKAWREWDDPACDVLAETEGEPHNTITPILRKNGKVYQLSLVLRNNRTSDEHPLGIFHPHAQLHHIKKENIGLIEVMGLFILPGRLKNELHDLAPYMTGEKPLMRPDETDPVAKHFDWLCDIIARNGLISDRMEAQRILRKEVADVCANVLRDAGVYKRNPEGEAGVVRFVKSLGFSKV
jgi:UDPglucose--hexose-1-phosphate uridylyltransferase